MSDREQALSRAAAAAVAGFAALIASTQTASAQLRIVQYNSGVWKTGQDTVYQNIGLEQVNGIAKPLDIMIVEEQTDSASGTAAAKATISLNTIVSHLNTLYGAGTYAAAPYPAAADSTG